MSSLNLKPAAEATARREPEISGAKRASYRDELAAALRAVILGKVEIPEGVLLDHALADAAIATSQAFGRDLYEVHGPGSDEPRLVTSWPSEALVERDRDARLVRRRWIPIGDPDDHHRAAPSSTPSPSSN